VEAFNTFLRCYLDACSRFDRDAVMAAVAADYSGVYHYPGGVLRAYDRCALSDGWSASAEYFGVAGARLEYQVMAAMAREEERIVAAWVTMPVPNGPPGRSFLLAAFAPRDGEWRLVREVMEHRVDPVAEDA
jgi:hypothetical protein